MADSVNKANKRQAGKTRKKLMYAAGFARSISNKIRRMKRHIRKHPTDLVTMNRLVYWTKDGYRERKGSKKHAGPARPSA